MDAVVYGALEEICSQGSSGLHIHNLWSKINPNLSTNGLNLCNNVKKAIWLNLLNIPSLNFECNGVLFDSGNPKIQLVDDCEAMDLKIVAKECLLNNFVGIYDIKASDAGVSQQQRRTLERLAIARTDGITQNELAKEFDIENKNIFYIVRNLESRGLIVRQSTIIRKKEADNEEYKNGSIIHTNMLHLYRYAKHLGHLQRLEITKGDISSTNEDNVVRESPTKDCVSKERIEDFLPAIKAICDRLEKADGKVLVVSDLKVELGYRKTRGHRAWRIILQKLKDANLVEEFFATVNNKAVSCVRLLKKFSPTSGPKSHGCGDDDLDAENVKVVKRGQITDQLFELPIEQQIYDMIDAEGSKGLTLNEVYKRLAINNKRYYPRILDMVSKFGMHLDSEGLNKGVAYRVWTSGNFNKKVPNIPPTDEKLLTHEEPGQQMLTHTIQDVDEQPNNQISSTNDTWLDSNDVIPDDELHIPGGKPVSDSVCLEISSSASPARRIRRSYTTYPCLGLNLVSSQREQRILEKLQEDKVLLKPELRRLLESLENKHTGMDKRTLERILNKLQKEEQCKCISFTVPSVSNCSRQRTIDVILHPSVYKATDLSERVHEKLRSFDWQVRDESYSRYKLGKCKPIPVLNDVERINTSVRIDVQSKTHEALKNNGFVLAKMVRAKLLHVFFWGYVTELPSCDDEQNNPHSSCKLLQLDAAIKVMPLELFLQVAGSSLQVESMVEKCRNGLCLSDLPVQEYRSLVDTRATSRLSYLIDILRRLKLIRLIGGSVPVGPHTTLRHSVELKPYIEEPVGMVLPSTGVCSDLRPHHRHDFVLATRKSVDEYWNTLEYCYAASDPKAALHAFPGSAVDEVFHVRSWASVRVMTAHQRAELVKIVANDDSDKKITYKKCEKIAEKLNLTLEQVLRVYYDKRVKDKSKQAGKRKRSSKRKSIDNEKTEITLDEEESVKKKHAKLLEDAAREEQNSSQRLIEYNETDMLTDEIDGEKEVVDDDVEIIEDIHNRALPKLKNSRQKRFLWTENQDRQLVIEYVKHRVVVGAKFHRIDWASIENLPGPPNTCRRRISTLRRNIQFKKALLGLCNLLSVRYAKHLETSKNKSVVGDYRMITHHLTNDLNLEEQWDNFENKDIKMILDQVLKYKQVAKSDVIKDAQYVSKYPKSKVVVGAEGHEFDENNLCSSSATHIDEKIKNGGKRKASVSRSRKRLPKSCLLVMNKVKDFNTQVYKSLAVSNAIELFKLIFLSTAKAPEVPNLLAETLRRYSEHDLFTAFNYLRDKGFMVRGNDVSHFALSQPFLRSISSSPFPVNTGKRADKMVKFLHENESDLLETGLNLSADLQCGDLLQLCLLICTGEISIFPCLPSEGVGQIDDLKKRKCDENEICSVEIATKKPKVSDTEIFSRKEKGFPGIQLSLTRSLISRNDIIKLSSDNSSSCERVEGVIKSNIGSESTWESMTCYARNLTLSGQEQSFLNPNVFKIVYSAVKNAGDQGLSMDEISLIIDVQGENNAEIIVEVLESFGHVLKVNAYDSVNVVDSLYRSKYLLTSMAIHQHNLRHKLPESNQENISKKLKNTTPKSAEIAEVHGTTDEVHHRVTILNHTEEASQPINESESNNETERMSSKTGPHQEEKYEFRFGDYSSFKPILPWVNGDGTVNKIVYKGLVRRVLGIVMQNPGILEENVLNQMDVLNPQSCKKLLELMILDSHINVRKMYQSVSNEPPAILHSLLGCNLNKPKLVCKKHLFANPNSIRFL